MSDEWLMVHVKEIHADLKRVEEKVDVLIVKEAKREGKSAVMSAVISTVISIVISIIAIAAKQ